MLVAVPLALLVLALAIVAGAEVHLVQPMRRPMLRLAPAPLAAVDVDARRPRSVARHAPAQPTIHAPRRHLRATSAVTDAAAANASVACPEGKES